MPKAIETRVCELVAIVGDDGAVIAVGWPSGAQGGMSALSRDEAKQFRAYLDRFLAREREA